jgi:hypothetical protein
MQRYLCTACAAGDLDTDIVNRYGLIEPPSRQPHGGNTRGTCALYLVRHETITPLLCKRNPVIVADWQLNQYGKNFRRV